MAEDRKDEESRDETSALDEMLAWTQGEGPSEAEAPPPPEAEVEAEIVAPDPPEFFIEGPVAPEFSIPPAAAEPAIDVLPPAFDEPAIEVSPPDDFSFDEPGIDVSPPAWPEADRIDAPSPDRFEFDQPGPAIQYGGFRATEAAPTPVRPPEFSPSEPGVEIPPPVEERPERTIDPPFFRAGGSEPRSFEADLRPDESAFRGTDTPASDLDSAGDDARDSLDQVIGSMTRILEDQAQTLRAVLSRLDDIESEGERRGAY